MGRQRAGLLAPMSSSRQSGRFEIAINLAFGMREIVRGEMFWNDRCFG